MYLLECKCMKIILSRKGFDQGYGGTPSPILPDGTLLSFPIPCSSDKNRYDNLYYEKQSYLDIWQELQPRRRKAFDEYCHLDPDIRKNIISRPKNWKAIFGQMGGSQTHLQNRIDVGDIFLFFGWFKQTEIINDRLCYCGDDKHVLFGYLQIGDIVPANDPERNIFDWHPHSNITNSKYRNDNNTLYIAADKLSFADGKDTDFPGAGTFKFSDELVLTKQGKTRSQWELPDFFKELNITHHSESNFKGDYFQSARIGQEFIIEESKESKDVLLWAKNLITKNFDEKNHY